MTRTLAALLAVIAAALGLVAAVPALIRPGALSPAMLLAEACMVGMFAAPLALAVLGVSASRRLIRRRGPGSARG